MMREGAMEFCRTDEGGSQTGIETCRRWMGEDPKRWHTGLGLGRDGITDGSVYERSTEGGRKVEGDEERCDNHVGTFTAEGVYRGPMQRGGYILSSWLGKSNASGRLLRQARHLTNRGGDSDGKCWWAYGRRTNEAV
eukprot:g65919.t1